MSIEALRQVVAEVDRLESQLEGLMSFLEVLKVHLTLHQLEHGPISHSTEIKKYWDAVVNLHQMGILSVDNHGVVSLRNSVTALTLDQLKAELEY